MRKVFAIVLSLAAVLAACSKRNDAKPQPPAPLQLLSLRPNTPASSMVERDYAMGNAGVIHLTFSNTWNDSIVQVKGTNRALNMIRFLPSSGGDFETLVEIRFVGEAATGQLDTAARLQELGKSDLTHSVEKSLDIQNFSGEHGSGSYFLITDKSMSMLQEPAPGNFRYLMRGFAKLTNGVILPFWLASNHIENEQAAVLEVIKTARFVPNADGQTSAPH